jgi:fluoride exporter
VRVLLVGIGGFAGSVLRYWLSGLAQSAARESAFPVGTLVVNLLGCLTIGVLSELAEARGFLTPERRALIVVGLLGGFTTFSAFANESVNAARDGAYLVAVANVVLTVGVCLLAVWAGRSIAHAIWR